MAVMESSEQSGGCFCLGINIGSYLGVGHLSAMKRKIVLEEIPEIVNLIICVQKKKHHCALGHQM